MTPERHVFPIARIGGAARRGLAPGRQGSVLAVFRRSFYVELDGGALVCIGPQRMGAGPLNALAPLPDGLDWRASGLAEGAPVVASRQGLEVGIRFGFSHDAAEPWSPVYPGSISTTTLSAGLVTLRQAASSFDLSEGFARLVVDETSEDRLVRRGRAGARALTAWLADAGAGAPSTEVEALIGLGPGLTPSGDDFIGGAMIALGALGKKDLGARLAAWALPLARVRTGKISFAHLACAADGEGAEALHAVISAITANDGEAIAPALAGLDAIGHSSGWDALAGAATVMRAFSA